MNMTGWVKLHREILKKAIWTESTSKQKVILITLLTMANHDEKQWEWNGKKYVAKPGQFVTSLKSIAKNAGDDISIQNVRTALLRFEKYEFLTDQSTNRNRLITIVNWEFYQDIKDGLTSKPTGIQQATNRQLTTNKNDKECKNERKKIEEEEKLKLILGEIEDLKKSFSPGVRSLIEPYWEVIKRTRKTNTVQPNVILTTMKKWLKFEEIVVQYALKKHIQSYADSDKKENYTIGIMNGTTPEKATEHMDLKVVEFKSRTEPSRRTDEFFDTNAKFGAD